MWACDPTITTPIVNSYQVAGPVFMQALQSLFAAQCAMVGDHLWPVDATEAVLKDPYYDFIVVGAGSAGATVASRLSEISDWKVLLVEAGGDPTLSTETPQLFYSNMDTEVDWGYKTTPQDGACRSYKTKGCSWPRGKVLGGSSSINAMIYVRGNKADYDEWAADGNIGWSYEDVLPYFKKSENYTGDLTDEKKKYHGINGPLNVDDNNVLTELEKMIINGGIELGMEHSSDINGASQMGTIKSQSTIKNGLRFSTARAFLGPAKDRKNFHVIKNALATKILFKPNTNVVTGILLNKDGKNIKVNVKKELIISAGAINSPQLLLLSGIGPQQHLKDLNIDIKADLPVGENLQDHLFVPLFYTSPGEKHLNYMPNIVSLFVEYILNNKGLLSDTSPHRVTSFINTTDSSSSLSDIQFHYVNLPPSMNYLLDIFRKHDLNDEARSAFDKMGADNFVMVVYTVLLKPKSVGRLLLKSTNPNDHPLLYANYFEDPEDMKTIIRALRQHALKLDETKAFKEAGFKLNWLELEACKEYKKLSDEFLECISRELTFSLYHPMSTCKMGPANDDTAVVDPELKVRKVQGLRVIDASIIPTAVRGNTNAPTIMIGEKGADMIKKTWLASHTEL